MLNSTSGKTRGQLFPSRWPAGYPKQHTKRGKELNHYGRHQVLNSTSGKTRVQLFPSRRPPGYPKQHTKRGKELNPYGRHQVFNSTSGKTRVQLFPSRRPPGCPKQSEQKETGRTTTVTDNNEITALERPIIHYYWGRKPVYVRRINGPRFC